MIPGTLDAQTFCAAADHTLLASDTTAAELQDFLANARELGVRRVCVSPSLLPLSVADIDVVTVVGFPSGAHRADVKAVEAARAVADGASEIDMVINRALVHGGEWAALEAEIREVREACPGRTLKAILETVALSDDEIVESCRAARAAGADFVKTSTGYHPAGGASVHAVRLMAETVGGELGVKASGGIRSVRAATELWSAGATRFGVSATAAILTEFATGDATPGDPHPSVQPRDY